MTDAPALQEATPRERQIQHVTMKLLEDNRSKQVRHMEKLFKEWQALPEEERKGFFEFAHKRRHLELGSG